MAESTAGFDLTREPTRGRARRRGERLRSPLPMLANAVSVMLGKLSAMALGFLFWLVAARMFDPAEVGLAAAVVAGMMLCTQLALLGVGSAVIHDYPDHQRRPGELLNPAITLITLSALVTGAGFTLVAALGSGELHVLGSEPAYLALFLGTCVFGTLGILFDQTSIALRRGDQVLSRGIVFGAAAVLALVGCAQLSDGRASVLIFAPWLIAGFGACALAGWHLRRSLPEYRPRASLRPAMTRRLVGVGLPNWALTLTERAPGLVLPLIVIELLSPEANAAWYAVWMMAWVIYVVPISIGLTLFAEARHRPAALRQATGQGIWAALAIGGAAAAALALLAPFALSLLGPHYADAGTEPLRILVWAVVPMVFVQAYFSSCRAVGRLGEAIATGAVSGVVSVVAASAAGARYGLVGMAVAWLVCQALTGAWAITRLRAGRSSSRVAAAVDVPVPVPGWRAWRPRRADRPAAARPADLAARRAWSLATLADWAPPVGLLALAVPAWFVSLRHVQPEQFDDLGVISALPGLSFVALGALGLGFALCLRRADRGWLLPASYVAGLIVMLNVVRPLVEPEPAFRVTFRHVGVTDYILRTGGIDPLIDAYFNWPGFFIVSALVVRLAGLESALPLTDWFPLAFNLALIGPLWMIYRTATRDPRVIWLGIWLFMLANWVGQDYFSPQAMALFLHLAMLGVILGWFMKERVPRAERWRGAAAVRARRLVARIAPDRAHPDRDRPAPPISTPARRAALMGIAILLYAAIVPTHQLTPFAGILGVGAIVLAGVCSARRLPVLMIVMVAGWLSFLAISYITGHLASVTGQVGDVETTVGSSVGGRIVGSNEHLLAVYLRLLVTAAIWSAAGVGVLRAWRAGRRLLPYVLLAVTPFPLLLGQSYGGEILLRVYLFGLPFMALLAAFAVFPRSDRGRSWLTTGVVCILSVALLAGYLVARYGNERMDYYTTAEVAAVQRLYEAAPEGSLLVAGTGNLPWKSQEYESYDYRVAVESESWALSLQGGPAEAILDEIILEMRGRGEQGAFFIVTRAQKAEVDLVGLGPPGALDRLEQEAADSPQLRILFRNEDGTVFVLPGYRPILDA